MIDIEECKQIAKKLNKEQAAHDLYQARCRAIEVFPDLVDEHVAVRKKQPAFAIGDRVRIIGPAHFGSRKEIGKEFTIEEIDSDKEYGAADVFWYPASSLELVELKVGDWVEVVGPISGDPNGFVNKGIKREITSVGDKQYLVAHWWYPASSLMKIQKPDQTIAEAREELRVKIDKGPQAIHDILAPLVDERLDEIDKLLTIHGWRLDCLQKV